LSILDIRHVSKNFGRHVALDDVSLSIDQDAIFGLLGPNGAGKTTLIRIITKIYAADKGEIFFKNKPLAPSDIFNIGYLPEERGLYRKMMVGEQLLYLSKLKGLSHSEATRRIRYWLERFEMASWWKKKIEELSKGMQQKVQFVSTILHEPELIILDEPFSGFDPVNVNLIKEEILRLREQGSTIIFSTHRMDSIEELCDHIALIDKSKKILSGGKHEIKERYKEHLFEFVHRGSLSTLNGHFQVVSTRDMHDEWKITRIKAEEQMDSNAVIRTLIDHMEIRSFKEVLPSMNEIFIKQVKKGGGDE